MYFFNYYTLCADQPKNNLHYDDIVYIEAS